MCIVWMGCKLCVMLNVCIMKQLAQWWSMCIIRTWKKDSRQIGKICYFFCRLPGCSFQGACYGDFCRCYTLRRSGQQPLSWLWLVHGHVTHCSPGQCRQQLPTWHCRGYVVTAVWAEDTGMTSNCWRRTALPPKVCWQIKQLIGLIMAVLKAKTKSSLSIYFKLT